MAKNYYETENEIMLDVGKSINAIKKSGYYTMGLGVISIINGNMFVPSPILIGMGFILILLGLAGIFIRNEDKIFESISKNMEKKAAKKGKRLVYQNVPYRIRIPEQPNASRFCIKCGKKLVENQEICGNCGADNHPIV